MAGQRVAGAGGGGARRGDPVPAVACGTGRDRVRAVARVASRCGDPRRRRIGKPRPRNDFGDGQDRHPDHGAPRRHRRRGRARPRCDRDPADGGLGGSDVSACVGRGDRHRGAGPRSAAVATHRGGRGTRPRRHRHPGRSAGSGRQTLARHREHGMGPRGGESRPARRRRDRVGLPRRAAHWRGVAARPAASPRAAHPAPVTRGRTEPIGHADRRPRRARPRGRRGAGSGRGVRGTKPGRQGGSRARRKGPRRDRDGRRRGQRRTRAGRGQRRRGDGRPRCHRVLGGRRHRVDHRSTGAARRCDGHRPLVTAHRRAERGGRHGPVAGRDGRRRHRVAARRPPGHWCRRPSTSP